MRPSELDDVLTRQRNYTGPANLPGRMRRRPHKAVELPQEPQIEAYKAKVHARMGKPRVPLNRTVRASQAHSQTMRKAPISLPTLSILKD